MISKAGKYVKEAVYLERMAGKSRAASLRIYYLCNQPLLCNAPRKVGGLPPLPSLTLLQLLRKAGRFIWPPPPAFP